MKKIDSIITSFKSESRYSFYLSFFRVLVCVLLLKELLFQWNLIPLLYSGKDYLIASNNVISELFISFHTDFIRDNIYLYLAMYLLLIILFLFGIGKNFTAIVLFLFYDILQKLCPQILNGGDNFLRFIMLYFCFANTFDFFSITKYNTGRFSKIRNFCSNLAALSICIHLCFIYFISAIHKIHADVWFNGVATYYIFNLERFNGTSLNNILAKNAFFVCLSTYFTWFIELLYPILIWYKQTRKLMIVLAIMLHTGIAILMMLYNFQLVFIFVQGFFVSNADWLKIYHTAGQKITLGKLKHINLHAKVNAFE